MAKIIILAVFVASVSAQFEDNHRINGERGNLRINNEELRVNQDYQDEGLRVNPRHRHRNPENINVGGFQNGNFAPNDGRLRTNLDSGRTVSENSGQNNFRSRDETYVVEEGAAFRKKENGRFDVHSSQGRVVDASYLTTEDGNFHEDNRRQSPNFETQENGQRIEQIPTNTKKRNQNVNGQANSEQSLYFNGQSDTTKVNNNENRSSNQNTRDRNNQGDDNDDRVTNLDHSNTRLSEPNIYYNAQNDPRNNNQNRFNSQNSRGDRNQNERERNDGQSNSRQSAQHIDAENNNQNRFSNQGTPSTNGNRNQNSGANFDDTSDTVTKINSNSRAIADKASKNHQNYDREAMDREINNQITKMIFEESTQPEIRKNNTKTTQDNELGPSRSSSGKQDDKWIWSDGQEMNVTTKSPKIPEVDDRAAFAADQCPTGQVKFNNVCTDVD